jgi:hypothetical protein
MKHQHPSPSNLGMQLRTTVQIYQFLMSKSIKNLSDSLVKTVHVLKWFIVTHSHYNTGEIMHLQGRVTSKWNLMVMSVISCSAVKETFPATLVTSAQFTLWMTTELRSVAYNINFIPVKQHYSEHSPQVYVSKTTDAEYMNHTSANKKWKNLNVVNNDQ